MTHIKYDTGIARAYHRIAGERDKRVAIIAAACKLLSIVILS